MPYLRVVCGLFLFASGGFGADLKLLSNKEIAGDVTGISETEIVLQTKDGPVKTALTNALELRLQPPPAFKVPPSTQVTLSDGSVLYCKPEGGVRLVGENKAELTLLSDVKVQVPFNQLRAIVKDAHEPKKNVANDGWAKCVARTEKTSPAATKLKPADVVVLRGANGVLDPIRGELRGTGKDTDVDFDQYTGDGEQGRKSRSLSLASPNVAAILFAKQANPDAAPSVCKLYDMEGNRLNVAKLSCKDGATLDATTVVGARVSYPLKQLARLDFSTGKIVYISDLLEGMVKNGGNEENIAVKIVKQPDEGRLDRIRWNVNLDDKELKLRMGSDGKLQTFPKGLALPAPAEIVYKLDGLYDEFSGLLGVDDAVLGDSHVKFTLLADGKAVLVAEVTRNMALEEGKDKKDAGRVLAIRKNIKDVKELRIRVEPMQGVLPYGHHVNLADAKITKEIK